MVLGIFYFPLSATISRNLSPSLLCCLGRFFQLTDPRIPGSIDFVATVQMLTQTEQRQESFCLVAPSLEFPVITCRTGSWRMPYRATSSIEMPNYCIDFHMTFQFRIRHMGPHPAAAHSCPIKVGQRPTLYRWGLSIHNYWNVTYYK